ncbi:MAG: glutamate-1-semialdehyde 2,1-aminomutase, partial [Parcubacteria group bacterium Gr01-1014_49]
ALATLKKMKKVGVAKHLLASGKKVRAGWTALAEKHGLSITLGGVVPISSFIFQHGKDSQAMKTLFVQEMLDRGFLASNLYFASCAHTDAHIKQYLQAADGAFRTIADAVAKGEVHKRLRGPIAHTGFARLN